MGPSTWRSLNSVMLVTLHVAVIASILRSLGRPSTPTESLIICVPLSIVVGAFLSWPMGRALSAAFHPEANSGAGRCHACGNFELRPLLRAGAGLFQPVVGYRCARCRTTHRVVEGGVVLEKPFVAPDPAEPTGIEFPGDPPPPPLDLGGIRFLDEDRENRPGPANFPAGPVSRD